MLKKLKENIKNYNKSVKLYMNKMRLSAKRHELLKIIRNYRGKIQ